MRSVLASRFVRLAAALALLAGGLAYGGMQFHSAVIPGAQINPQVTDGGHPPPPPSKIMQTFQSDRVLSADGTHPPPPPENSFSVPVGAVVSRETLTADGTHPPPPPSWLMPAYV